MRVRTAVDADVDAVATVHVESWRSTYRGTVADDYLAALSVERRAERWRWLIADTGPDRGVLVLDDDERVVGLCHYAPSRDAGEVTAIYLLAGHWRGGGGTLLLDAAVAAMTDAGYPRATLWVLEGNDRARAFYEARGWVHDGATKLEAIGSVEVRELRYQRVLRR